MWCDWHLKSKIDAVEGTERWQTTENQSSKEKAGSAAFSFLLCEAQKTLDIYF